MNKSDLKRNYYMLKGPLAKNGYDWWWHSFTAYERESKKAKSFFIEYYICNPKRGSDKPILGQLKENQENKIYPSYFMMKVGTWGENPKQIHNFYPINMFQYKNDKLELKIGECTLTESHMKGKCSLSYQDAKEHPEYMSDWGDMTWDIKIDKQIAYNVGYGASRIFRKLNLFEMFWHAEGIKTEYSGTLTLDGVIYDVIPEKSYGYSDKNWGTDFTSPWVWLSSCNLKSLITNKKLENSAFEVGGGRPKILGVPLNRKLLIGLYYENTMYDYNFSKFWNNIKTDFSFNEGVEYCTWNVTSENKYSKIEITIKCKKEEMLLINYEAPNGKKLHNKLFNGGTGFGEIKLYEKARGNNVLIDHIEVKNVGCEYGEY